MTLKNNRAPLLCCFQLCAWFHCHMCIRAGVKSQETAKLGVDLCDLGPWPLTLTFCMDITSDNGNISWKFHDDTMMGTWWKRCDGRTDRQTDRQTDGLNQSYSCLVAAKNANTGWAWPFQIVIHFMVHCHHAWSKPLMEYFKFHGCAKISWAQPFYKAIRFMLLFIIPPNFRPIAEILNDLER